MANAGYLRSTVEWYGGIGLLTTQVARNLALPPKYARLVIQEIEVMGVRSAGVALVAAVFTGMVLALQTGSPPPAGLAQRPELQRALANGVAWSSPAQPVRDAVPIPRR